MSSSPLSSPQLQPLAKATEAAQKTRIDAAPRTPRPPLQRPRRLRRTGMLRRMVRETMLTVDDLIYPLFVMEGENRQEEVPSMPGCFRYSLDLLVAEVKAAQALGIGAIALFPLISDMMDGRVGAIRQALDAAGWIDVGILAYSAKYASAYYSPFRDVLDSAC